jgi:hypothetical protein
MNFHFRRRFWLYLRLAIFITLALSAFPPFENPPASQTIDFQRDYLWIGAVAFFIGGPIILFFWLRSNPQKPDYPFRSLVLSAPFGVSGKYAFSTWAFLSTVAFLIGIFDIPYAVSSGQWTLTLLTILMGVAFSTATFLAYFGARKLA